MKNKPQRNNASKVVLECAENIPIKKTKWIFNKWLPRGALVLLAGMPGAGKTGLAMGIAAQISNGGSRGHSWAGGLTAPPGSVVILTYEDDVDTTIMSRLAANGADRRYIHIVRGTKRFDGETQVFEFSSDLGLLLNQIDELGDVALVIIDPVISVVKGDALKNQEVRKSFAPLIARAQARQFTILGITHFNKGSAKKHPLDRITGSGAFSQLARAVLVAVKIDGGDAEVSTRKQGLLVRAKMVGEEDDGFVYEIEPCIVRASDGSSADTARIIWPDKPPILGSAKKLIAWAENGGNSDESSSSMLEHAEDFLHHVLENGQAIPTKEVEFLAAEARISKATLKRARASLGVISTKVRGVAGDMHTLLSLPERVSKRSGGIHLDEVGLQQDRDIDDEVFDPSDLRSKPSKSCGGVRQQSQADHQSGYAEDGEQVEPVEPVEPVDVAAEAAQVFQLESEVLREGAVALFTAFMETAQVPDDSEIWEAAGDLLPQLEVKKF